MTSIKYVGVRPTYTDGTYASRITFAQGETRLVPDDIAAKMLRHPDVYALGDVADVETSAMATDTPAPKASKDDEETQSLRDAVSTMDKDALATFAKTHFNQTLNARMGLDKARQKVVGLIDQYGVA